MVEKSENKNYQIKISCPFHPLLLSHRHNISLHPSSCSVSPTMKMDNIQTFVKSILLHFRPFLNQGIDSFSPLALIIEFSLESRLLLDEVNKHYFNP